MLIAGKAAEVAKKVRVYDFPEKGVLASKLPAEELKEILALPNNISIYKAEDIDRTMAWSQLQSLAQREIDPVGVHPEVREYLPHLKHASSHPKLERMAEELAVFLNSYADPNCVQLSSHEHGTIALVRALPAEIQKQYAYIRTGITENGEDGSEFRRKRIPKIEGFADRLILRDSQGQKYRDFYDIVLDMLTEQITTSAKKAHPDIVVTKDMWREDAERKGLRPYTNVSYHKSLDEWNEGISWGNFLEDKKVYQKNSRSRHFITITKKIHESLLVHTIHANEEIDADLIAKNEEELRNIHEAYAKTIEQSLNAVSAAQVDIPYVLELLSLQVNSISKNTKDKIVNCMIAQYKDGVPEEAKELLEKFESTNEIFKLRLKKTKLTPEERKKGKEQRREQSEKKAAMLKAISQSVDEFLNRYEKNPLTPSEYITLAGIETYKISPALQQRLVEVYSQGHDELEGDAFIAFDNTLAEKNISLYRRMLEYRRQVRNRG
jgi:hypothetical protein